jgi:hypothetical protein
MKKHSYKRTKQSKHSASRSVASVLSMNSVLNPDSSVLEFRPYQRRAFENKTSGIEVWLWGRQTGKSYTLAAWAVDRLLTRPGFLVTVLSNSKTNGMEFNVQVAKVCEKLGQAFKSADLSPDKRYETMNCEIRIRVQGKVGRFKILAANPRTARGFSGDLILDEFAFHEDSNAIWNAAESILSSNADYLCRIASTPNGKHNLFYRFCTNGYPVLKVTRTDAYAQGCPIYDQVAREKIDPVTARARPEQTHLRSKLRVRLRRREHGSAHARSHHAAERPNVGVICEYDSSAAALDLLRKASRRNARPQNIPAMGRAGRRPGRHDPSRHYERLQWLRR